MNIEETKLFINQLVHKYGYFVLNYKKPHQIGEIVPLAFTEPKMGKGLIIGISTMEEFKEMFGDRTRIVGSYFYRLVVD